MTDIGEGLKGLTQKNINQSTGQLAMFRDEKRELIMSTELHWHTDIRQGYIANGYPHFSRLPEAILHFIANGTIALTQEIIRYIEDRSIRTFLHENGLLRTVEE